MTEVRVSWLGDIAGLDALIVGAEGGQHHARTTIATEAFTCDEGAGWVADVPVRLAFDEAAPEEDLVWYLSATAALQPGYKARRKGSFLGPWSSERFGVTFLD